MPKRESQDRGCVSGSTNEAPVIENQSGRQRHPEPTSPVATAAGATREPEWIGLSEVQAMTLAQKLQRGGIFIAPKQALVDPDGADRERTQDPANRNG